MKTWKCEVCGYIHNGDRAPGSCPVCGADTECFSPFKITTVDREPLTAGAWQCGVCNYLHRAAAPPFGLPGLQRHRQPVFSAAQP